jgi:hypothetical protein
MSKLITTLSTAGLMVLAGACTDSKRERTATTFTDRPADITCWSFGQETFSGRSTGKVSHAEEGFVGFVDAANGRYTTINGDCRVVYLAPEK